MPNTEPINELKIENTQAFLMPSLLTMAAAGKAMIIAIMLNMEESQPAVVMLMFISICNASMQGTALFCVIAIAIAPNTAHIITRHAFLFIFSPYKTWQPDNVRLPWHLYALCSPI